MASRLWSPFLRIVKERLDGERIANQECFTADAGGCRSVGEPAIVNFNLIDAADATNCDALQQLGGGMGGDGFVSLALDTLTCFNLPNS